MHSTEGTEESGFSPLKCFLSVSKKQAVFYYKVVYSLSVFIYFLICTGDGGREAGLDCFGSNLDSFFVNYETFFTVLSIVSMCTGSYVVM